MSKIITKRVSGIDCKYTWECKNLFRATYMFPNSSYRRVRVAFKKWQKADNGWICLQMMKFQYQMTQY